jgi:hypothetical protein
MKSSNLFGLNWLDVLKATIMAFLTGAIAVIGQAVEGPMVAVPTHAQLILALKAGIGAAIAYLIKNFFTPASTPVIVTPVEATETK